MRKKTAAQRRPALVRALALRAAGIGWNADNAVFRVRHALLARSGDSPYRSQCPSCRDGVLLMRRGSGGQLLRDDYCVVCGQHIFYTDICDDI